MLWGIMIALLSIVTDQLSKLWILDNISFNHFIAIGPYFNIIKVWNTGVSFSLFNGYGLAGTICLCLVALSVCAFLIYWMTKESVKLKIVCLGLIVGGALGNVTDRVVHGAVLDFLDFHYKSYHWPAFNLADTYICIGAFILILHELYYGYINRKEKHESS